MNSFARVAVKCEETNDRMKENLTLTHICQQSGTKTSGSNGPDITHLGILPQLIKVLQWMVHGVNLQIFMQSLGVLETSLVIFNNIFWD